MKSLIKKILKEISPPLIIRIFNKLKLFFKKTPIINIEKIDNDKKISGSNIFKLLIILI